MSENKPPSITEVLSERILTSLFEAPHGMTRDMLFDSVKEVSGTTMEQFHYAFVGLKGHKNQVKDALVFPKRGVCFRGYVLSVEGERACDWMAGRCSDAVEKRLRKAIIQCLKQQKDQTQGLFFSDLPKPNGVKDARMHAAIRDLEEAGVVRSELVAPKGYCRTRITLRPAPV